MVKQTHSKEKKQQIVKQTQQIVKQTHGFSKKKKKKTQYMCPPIHQVKHKLKSET